MLLAASRRKDFITDIAYELVRINGNKNYFIPTEAYISFYNTKWCGNKENLIYAIAVFCDKKVFINYYPAPDIAYDDLRQQVFKEIADPEIGWKSIQGLDSEVLWIHEDKALGSFIKEIRNLFRQLFIKT